MSESPHIVLDEADLLDALNRHAHGATGPVPLHISVHDDGDVWRASTATPARAADLDGLLVPLAATPTSVEALSHLRPHSGAPLLVLVSRAAGCVDASAWRCVEGAWQACSLYVAPSSASVHDRNRGILESDLLAGARVAIVGVGSGGASTAMELAKAGVGGFVLVDNDRIETTNVGRHVCDTRDLGRKKVVAMRERILARNPAASVQALHMDVLADEAAFEAAIADCDVIVGGTDNNATRRLINEIALDRGIPAIFGRAWVRARGGDVLRVVPGGACFECLLDLRQVEEEVTASRAQATAYADAPVVAEPGLALDIAPISLMCARLVLQELVRGRGSALESLDADLPGSYFLWANRREGEFEHWEPAGYRMNGLHVQRWYAVRTPRKPDCHACGEGEACLEGLRAELEGVAADRLEFRQP